MTGFKIETLATAPAGSRDILDAIDAGLGFVPNVYGVFARAPNALSALAAINAGFDASSFTPGEREIIALTTSVYNQCPYCVAGHSTFALAHGVDPETVEAVRAGGLSKDTRLQVIGQLTLSILEKKGALGPSEIRSFLNAGFQPVHILELLVGIAGKTMTNFASKIARIPLDDAFAAQAWASATTKTPTAA
ncbi:carboxymuconolactone decarboxylase family protein [Hyphomonas johnsonii]|uniref:Carboxymuconolactone decarboxylase n=1 Tax=Hyphomonas johnsonii MHS-2 TaxID=1280950 RepID=A0A059FTU8_9PROT|nr:carboxymuconolactone decarboxylase family protein [Hyphomonas johnsonii]KCZ93893.1 carboxymuconolactone decarboxylase [Hyphomonas johnsonii MHS-2]